MPITWQNVNNRAGADPSQALNSAASLFNNAFAGVSKVMDQKESIDNANWNNDKAQNTLDAKAALMQYANAADFQKAQQSGDIGNLINKYGAQADRGALLDFADGRLNTLQNRDVQGITYNHTMLDENQAKDRDNIQSLLNSGDKDKIAQGLTLLGSTDLRVKSDLYQRGNEAQRRLIDLAHQDESHKWEGQKVKGQLDSWLADAAYKRAEAEIGRMNAQTSKDRLQIERQTALEQHTDRVQNQYSKAMEGLGTDPKTSIGTPAGAKVLNDALGSLKGDAQDVARRYVAQLIEQHPEMNVAGALAGLASVREQRWYETRNGVASDAVDRAVATAGSKPSLEFQKRQEAQYGGVIENVQALSQSLADARSREGQMYNPTKAFGPNKTVDSHGVVTDYNQLGQNGKPVQYHMDHNPFGDPDSPDTPVAAGSQRSEFNGGNGAKAPATMPYRPAAPVAPTVQQAVESNPEVKQLRDTLAKFANKPVQTMSVEDMRQKSQAEAALKGVLERAAQEAQAAAAVRQSPQFDPRMISGAVDQAAMAPLIDALRRR